MNYNERMLKLIKNLEYCYLNNDFDLLKTFFHEEVTFFSIGHDNLYTGIEDVSNIIKKEIESIDCQLNLKDYQVNQLDNNKYLIAISIELGNDLGQVRISGVIVDEANELKIYHVHVSTSCFNGEETTEKVEKILLLQNKKMQHLIESIPGGMFQCYNDENLTLIEMNQGFLDLVGYTREEIKQNFNDQLRLMINSFDYQSNVPKIIEQLKEGKTKLVEYRIKCKNGKELWVLDKGTLNEIDGKMVFSCIIIDINDAKNAEEELKQGLERYQIILNQTNDVIYEWNIEENWIQYSSNFYKNFGHDCKGRKKLGAFKVNENVHPKDQHKMLECYEEIINGAEFTNVEIRIKDITGVHRWYRVRMTTIFNESHKPYRVVGIMTNIDNEVKQSNLLLKQAQEDPLTGLKNRNAVQQKIQNRLLDENQNGALLLIDIDNFKTINDTKGHLVGDAVLSNVATKMQHVFRNVDIIGRIGGDEFLIYVETNNFDIIAKRADQLLEMFANMNIEGVKISCSIGIALVPQDGKTFNEIYQKADQALYYVKNKGKNQYVFYNENHMSLVKLELNEDYIKNINRKIDRGITGINQALIEYTFKLLYNSIDIEDTLDNILEKIGKEFNVSRVYIFENTPDDKYCNNTYEWCNDGIEPQKDNLQNISYEKDIPGYLDNFNEQGIFYCQDITRLKEEHYRILESQNIKSILQCAIIEDGKIKGYLGFDECNSKRLWQQENIDNLIYISEIVSTFLLKKRAQERAIQESQNLKSVLDGQNAYIYVIDEKTHQLLWMNHLAQKHSPYARLGQLCYNVFLKLDQPCPNCPNNQVHGDGEHHGVEIYNSVVNIWVKSIASKINWYGQPAALITCFDISEYKKK